MQDKIFEKFRQLDGSVTREHSGTGLGLAISRELAGMLGGDITVHSDLGAGADFTVRLPVHCPRRAEGPGGETRPPPAAERSPPPSGEPPGDAVGAPQ